ncbi:MAG TPA: hypothetical protein VJ044_03245, partial [Candidatus Hodarchaeales archaeon]|nr:hypothetical protein [Candidatus Hodarchaeales archaeon]
MILGFLPSSELVSIIHTIKIGGVTFSAQEFINTIACEMPKLINLPSTTFAGFQGTTEYTLRSN